MNESRFQNILGVRVDCLSIEEVIKKIVYLVNSSSYGYICAINVHMFMEAQNSNGFKNIVNNAAIVCPDGMPIVWILRRLGVAKQQRITGYDITTSLIKEASDRGIGIGFLGGESIVLEKAIDSLRAANTNLIIKYAKSPPFRELTLFEKKSLINEINESGVSVLFVALGCPKQEKWMHENANEVKAVMLGVGAVVEFLAGSKKRAPEILQKYGFEWLYRLYQEPRRLFKRYVVLNSRFIILLLKKKYNDKSW